MERTYRIYKDCGFLWSHYTRGFRKPLWVNWKEYHNNGSFVLFDYWIKPHEGVVATDHDFLISRRLAFPALRYKLFGHHNEPNQTTPICIWSVCLARFSCRFAQVINPQSTTCKLLLVKANQKYKFDWNDWTKRKLSGCTFESLMSHHSLLHFQQRIYRWW